MRPTSLHRFPVLDRWGLTPFVGSPRGAARARPRKRCRRPSDLGRAASARGAVRHRRSRPARLPTESSGRARRLREGRGARGGSAPSPRPFFASSWQPSARASIHLPRSRPLWSRAREHWPSSGVRGRPRSHLTLWQWRRFQSWSCPGRTILRSTRSVTSWSANFVQSASCSQAADTRCSGTPTSTPPSRTSSSGLRPAKCFPP